jgi:hypothetical protein
MNGTDNIDKGYLQVNTYATDVGMPVDNATVRITDIATGDTIEELQTDSSGQTPVIELPAPPVENSLETNQPKPYSEYNVSITANGFDPFNVEGVQILPTSTALQNANLITQTQIAENEDNIAIQDHTLWGLFPAKIPEDEVKPLPESTGLVVLPGVVIPEYVVVHLGVPTDTSAQNVWIPFKDYVKNVTCCEIYSTWPEQTIRANVTAIISLTLNRVYTEWYRGKGYGFTITNSTAYDQAFDYGRNIFEEISVVVDEIFSTYITRPNIRQPLFAQFCDGNRVVCETGLQQWGSKYLGDVGYTAINILRNYYGYDVFYQSADRVEGIPVSFPGEVLTIGSTGTNVSTIQEQLNAISDNYPKIPKIRVDGVYGEATQNAVSIFQEVFNLPVTGSVDYATWYKISDIYVAVEKLSELQ